MSYTLLYSWKLSREKTFAVLWLFVKVFSGSVASSGAAKASNPRKFSPSKVSRYTVYSGTALCMCMLLAWTNPLTVNLK